MRRFRSRAGAVGVVALLAWSLVPSLAVATERDPNVTRRSVHDWLENNPQGFSVFGTPIGGTGSDANVILYFGYNPHLFPTPDRDAATPINEDVFTGVDPFGFPDGFDSILAMTPRPTRTRGIISQTELEDGGVVIEVRAFVTLGAVSIYDEEEIFGDGGFGSGGPGGCTSTGGGVGTGCNDLPGGSGEPSALLGQDANGVFNYSLKVDLEYTPEAVALAGGDLANGINPKLPFILPAFFGVVPGVTVTKYDVQGVMQGRVTEDAALAAKHGFVAGENIWLRYTDTAGEFGLELIRRR